MNEQTNRFWGLALTCIYLSCAFIDIALLAVCMRVRCVCVRARVCFFYASSFKVALDSRDRQAKRDKGRAEDSAAKPCRETVRLRDVQCKQGKPGHRAGGCR